MSKIIKYNTLEKLDACGEQLKLFKKLFGSEVNLTKRIILANYSKFNMDWAVNNLLNASALEEYLKITTSAQEEYEKIEVPAYVEYLKTIDSAQKEYLKVTAPAQEEYLKIEASALEEYEKVTAPAQKEYRKIRALAFYRLYKGE